MVREVRRRAASRKVAQRVHTVAMCCCCMATGVGIQTTTQHDEYDSQSPRLCFLIFVIQLFSRFLCVRDHCIHPVGLEPALATAGAATALSSIPQACKW